jgi:hypothetical protein
MWGLTALVSLMLYTVYENRGRIAAAGLTPRMSNPVGVSFKVGVETKKQIDAKVKAEKSIIGIVVMSADLRSNEAKSVYFSGDDPTLVATDRIAHEGGSTSVPMFTSDEKHNASTIHLINGQFNCQRFEDTLSAKIYPDLSMNTKSICKSSIPSYYGYFSGYIAVFMNIVPSQEQEEQLKLATEKLATDIYFRDVLATQFQDGAPK